MNDEELERLLQRYAPAGPPDALRDRAIAPPVDARRAWPWLVAASVLLCITLGAQTASIRVRRELVTPANAEAESELQALEEALGGGPEARRIAERLMFERALDRATERPVGTAGTTHE